MATQKHTLGDAPIELKHRDMMNELAKKLDGFFNGPDIPKHTGFVLMVFPFEDHGGRCNYISNANRGDVVTMLKEQLKRFEGQPDLTGHA